MTTAGDLELLVVQHNVVVSVPIEAEILTDVRMDDAVRVRPLNLVLPLLDGRVVGHHERDTSVGHTRGQNSGEGFARSDP